MHKKKPTREQKKKKKGVDTLDVVVEIDIENGAGACPVENL